VLLIVSPLSAISQTKSPLQAAIFDSVVEFTNVGNSPITIQDITINNRPECTNVDNQLKMQKELLENKVKSLQGQLQSAIDSPLKEQEQLKGTIQSYQALTITKSTNRNK
jgi:hypothetical protein